MKKPRITIVMPCWRRPYRTQLAIDCIKQQTVGDFEAFVIGDGCRVFKPVTDDPRFISFNWEKNMGGYGHAQVNYAIEHATGEYFLFMGNDDTIDIDHFEAYLYHIENTPLDFVVYLNVTDKGRPLKFQMKSWRVGHCALIIRTDFLKKMEAHKGMYNHDWFLIDNMMNAKGKYKVVENNVPTYHMDPYRWRGTGFDEDTMTRKADSLRFHSKVAKAVKRILVTLKLLKA